MCSTEASDLLQHLEFLDEHGYAFPIPLLTPQEVAYYRERVAEIEACLRRPLRRMDQPQLFFPWAYELASHPRLLDLMEMLLGPDLFIHTCRIFRKPPRNRAYVSWHQDGRYSTLNAHVAPTIWIALADSTVENGCVQVLRGSHKRGLLEQEETFAPDNLLNHGETARFELDERDIVNLELSAGELSIHHVNTLHRSLPNHSDRERIGFSMTFVGPDVQSSLIPAIRVRGHKPVTSLELTNRPGPTSVPLALSAYRRFHTERDLPLSLDRS